MKKRTARKLLVASLGVAAVSYACAKKPSTTPEPDPVGNLVAPTGEPVPTTSTAPTAVPPEPTEQVGNLVAPEPDPVPSDAGKP